MRHFCVILALLLLTVPSAAQTGAKRYHIDLLEAVDASRFPLVTIRFRVLDAEGKRPAEMPRADIVIFEDGKEVHRLQPVNLRQAPAAVVLAFDTSGSMTTGNKLAEGKRAAHRFFTVLDAETPCGLVLFHHRIHLQEPPRQDRERLKRLVADVQAAGGTAWLDATLAALDLLPAGSPDQRRAVVVMTDGRDVNSQHSLPEVVDAARRKGVAVYPVGLGEAGRLQAVRTALVLDRSGSMGDAGKLAGLKRAARRFVELMPSEAADTTLIAFNDKIEFLLEPVQFTAEKPKLLTAIDSLQPSGETRLWDAVMRGLRTLDASRTGAENSPRLVLVALTDGIDNRSETRRIETVIETARRLQIPVFMLGLGPRRELREEEMREVAIRTGGQYYHVASAAQLTDLFENLSVDLHDDGIDERSLRLLAEQTGGEYFHVRQAERLGQVFERVAVNLENTYAITFRSLRDRPDGTARGIEIRLGEWARTTSDYKTYGLITPLSEPRLYFGALGVLVLLLAVPRCFRRR